MHQTSGVCDGVCNPMHQTEKSGLDTDSFGCIIFKRLHHAIPS